MGPKYMSAHAVSLQGTEGRLPAYAWGNTASRSWAHTETEQYQAGDHGQKHVDHKQAIRGLIKAD
jgi:hypothetical protein